MLSFVHLLSIVPAAKLSSRIGFKHMIFVSNPLLILSYLIFLLKINFYYAAVLFGLHGAFFWTSYHVDFARFSRKGARGRQIGLLNIINTLFSVAGPFIGGILLVFSDFNLVFIISSVIILVSAIPFLLSKDIRYTAKFSIRKIFGREKCRNAVGFLGYGFETGIAHILWPVFIFVFILNNFALLGSVASISLLASMLFTLFVGRYTDINKNFLLKLGSLINSIVWGIRMLVSTAFQVFLIDSIAGASRMLVEIPVSAATYDNAAKSGLVEYIIFREIALFSGRVILFAGLLLMSNFIGSFFAAAGASLLFVNVL